MSTLQGQQFADQLGVPFFETSALTDTNVDLAFFTIIQEWSKKNGAFQTLRSLPIWPDLIEGDEQTLRDLISMLELSRNIQQELLLFCVSHSYRKSVQWILENLTFRPSECVIRGTSFFTEALHAGDPHIIELLRRYRLTFGRDELDFQVPQGYLRSSPRHIRLVVFGAFKRSESAFSDFFPQK